MCVCFGGHYSATVGMNKNRRADKQSKRTLYVRVCMCMCMCMRMCMCMCVCTCMCMCMCMCMCVEVYVCAYICIHMYIYRATHTYIHTCRHTAPAYNRRWSLKLASHVMQLFTHRHRAPFLERDSTRRTNYAPATGRLGFRVYLKPRF